LEEGLARRGSRERLVTVTFDDGDATVADVAQFVLEDLGIRALVYVSAGYVEAGSTMERRPAMVVEALRAWVKSGRDVGSHTVTHCDLRLASPEEREEELVLSRRMLEAWIGGPLRHLSYPWGQYDEEVVSAVRRLDWVTAATIDRGWNDSRSDPLRLRRDLVGAHWSYAELVLRLGLGSFQPVYQLTRRLRGVGKRRSTT
jgi:peptidoglycan/xylan/chitin deacetylase (PgdA/CDA1 family)